MTSLLDSILIKSVFYLRARLKLLKLMISLISYADRAVAAKTYCSSFCFKKELLCLSIVFDTKPSGENVTTFIFSQTSGL